VDSAAPLNRRWPWRRACSSGRAILFRPGARRRFIVPSDIQFDIFSFLAVPPQNYGADVQFQLPPVRTVSHAKARVSKNPLRLLPVRPALTARAGSEGLRSRAALHNAHGFPGRGAGTAADPGGPGGNEPRTWHTRPALSVGARPPARRRDHTGSTLSSATPDAAPPPSRPDN
jgi:hypothetical protein